MSLPWGSWNEVSVKLAEEHLPSFLLDEPTIIPPWDFETQSEKNQGVVWLAGSYFKWPAEHPGLPT